MSESDIEDDDARLDDVEPAEPALEEVAEPVLESNFVNDVKRIDATKYIIVPADERITSHYLTKFEYTSIVSIRAEQIARFGNCMIDQTGDAEYSAEQELRQRRCPLCVERHVGYVEKNGALVRVIEVWDANDMEFPY